MRILESTHYLLEIPTDPEELATLLENYAMDWGTVLDFLSTVAMRRGVVLDVPKVCEIMKRKYEE